MKNPFDDWQLAIEAKGIHVLCVVNECMNEAENNGFCTEHAECDECFHRDTEKHGLDIYCLECGYSFNSDMLGGDGEDD